MDWLTPGLSKKCRMHETISDSSSPFFFLGRVLRHDLRRYCTPCDAPGVRLSRLLVAPRISYLQTRPRFSKKIGAGIARSSRLVSDASKRVLHFVGGQVFEQTKRITLCVALSSVAMGAVAEPIAIPRGMALRPKLTREEFQAQQEAKLREGAKMYEQYFLHDMVKAMRKTVTPGFAQPSYGEKIYREQLDSRYVEAWAKKGGVGMADMIYNQLHERYFPKREVRPMGARPLRPAARPALPLVPKDEASQPKSSSM